MVMAGMTISSSIKKLCDSSSELLAKFKNGVTLRKLL